MSDASAGDGYSSLVVDLNLWGKCRGLPGPYPLVCHLLDTAAVADVLWDRYVQAGQRRAICQGLGVEEKHARQLVAWCAGLHDVGKVSPGFQGLVQDVSDVLVTYPPAPTDDRLGHDFAAHVWLASELATRGYVRGELIVRAPAVRIAQLLGGHHGKFHRLDIGELQAPLSAVPALGDGRWEEQRIALMDAIWRATGCPLPPARVQSPTAALVCGLVILADWLASQESFLSKRLPFIPTEATPTALHAHFGATRELAPEILREAGLIPIRLKPGRFEEEFPFVPNDLQRSVAERLRAQLDVTPGAGLLVVTAPMGEGKTETALHAARLMGEAAGATGIFVALPTMATADQMYSRVHDYAARRAEGFTPLTLLHSMAWMNPTYAQAPAEESSNQGETEFVGGDDDHGARVVVADWLRARKRGMLASLAVGTIDQALTAALPVRHNVLRLLGLSGKVFVVDEAHAYDAYMQGLLCLLLRWLGHLRTPVILLSATLPAQTTDRLIRAYLHGADHLNPPQSQVHYPGWIYADANTGNVTSTPVAVTSRELIVSTHRMTLDGDGRADRAAALQGLLAPVLHQGGCALVVCTTVAEAQATYQQLHAWREEMRDICDRIPELILLHARFPARRREEITQLVMTAFGKDGTSRPRAAVLVATQVVEQSLDLDFDLVVSDLAPIALLLQRAGRGHRHTRPLEMRGAFNQPELAVLIPTTGQGALKLPRAWTAVYDESLLTRTHNQLADAGRRRIVIPDDLQSLVDTVYDETFAEGTTDADTKRFAEEETRRQLADMVAIPSPRELVNLDKLTAADVDEELIATRLGADGIRALCCYVDPAGDRYLDPECRCRLPETGSGANSRFTRSHVRELLAETIPVRAGAWTSDPDTRPPECWQDDPWLRDLVLLPHSINHDGVVHPARAGDREFRLDRDLGLVMTQR